MGKRRVALLRAGVLATVAMACSWPAAAGEAVTPVDPREAARYDLAKRALMLLPPLQPGEGPSSPQGLTPEQGLHPSTPSERTEVPRLPTFPPEMDALSCGSPCMLGTLSATTPYYDIFLACGNGAFTARTGTSHSVTLAAGSPQNVIYGGAGGAPGTSDISFHFHDQALTYLSPGGGAACLFDPPDTAMEPASVGIEEEWTVSPAPGITATLREEIVAFGTTEADSGVRLTLGIANDATSVSSVNVGARWQIDYQNTSDDGPWFTPVTCDPVTFGTEQGTEHDFLPAEVQDFYRIRNNSGFPIFSNVTSTAPISGIADTNTPSRLVFGAWPSLRASVWDYVANEGASADSDSAVLWYAGYLPVDGRVLAPGELVRHSVVIFTSPDLVNCGSFVPGCAPVISVLPADQTICLGGSATLDASGISLTDCTGSILYDWSDGMGFTASGASITVAPTTTTDYRVLVSCGSDPTCNTTATVRVTVEQRPDFTTVVAADVDACNLGVKLGWLSATFHGPTGTGTYSLSRSEISCADAMMQPPLVMGLATNGWADLTTRPGGIYYYAVTAEDDTPAAACAPGGPFVGGPMTLACLASPVTDAFAPASPDGVYAALRARHLGDSVTMDWSLARPLLSGEHFHVLKAWDDPSSAFVRVNAEGDTSLTFTETNLSGRLQFFDIRVANICEDVSLPEYPPGWD